MSNPRLTIEIPAQGEHEYFAPGAVDKLPGRTIPVYLAGRYLEGVIVSARVVEDGAAFEVTVEIVDPEQVALVVPEPVRDDDPDERHRVYEVLGFTAEDFPLLDGSDEVRRKAQEEVNNQRAVNLDFIGRMYAQVEQRVVDQLKSGEDRP